MGFTLSEVVPWGRNLDEYCSMFCIDEDDKQGTIASFGDGPASFNAQMTSAGHKVVSFDPLYAFSAAEIRKRIAEVRDIVMQQVRENMQNYSWTDFRSPDDLECVRMEAMEQFLLDFEQGKKNGRYFSHALPDRLPYEDGTFDLGLSSHFLLLYPALGVDFHIAAIDEMLRVCREVRIFPIVDLDANASSVTERVVEHYGTTADLEVRDTQYAFQRGENKMLVLRARAGNVT